MSRDNQSKINKDLTAHLEQVFEPHCATATSESISWLQDHMDEYLTPQDSKIESEVKAQNGPVIAGRLWLYSHHIYRYTSKLAAICDSNSTANIETANFEVKLF